MVMGLRWRGGAGGGRHASRTTAVMPACLPACPPVTSLPCPAPPCCPPGLPAPPPCQVLLPRVQLRGRGAQRAGQQCGAGVVPACVARLQRVRLVRQEALVRRQAAPSVFWCRCSQRGWAGGRAQAEGRAGKAGTPAALRARPLPASSLHTHPHPTGSGCPQRMTARRGRCGGPTCRSTARCSTLTLRPTGDS